MHRQPVQKSPRQSLGQFLLRRSAAFAALFLFATSVPNAKAADLTRPQAAGAHIDACLQRSLADGFAPDQCVGHTLTACIDAAAANQTTVGTLACAEAASAAWQTRLDRHYESLAARLSPPYREALQEGQARWQAFRDIACEPWRGVFEGGTMGSVTAAGCVTDIIGRRALDLRELDEAAAL